jgi:hypothetical protein
MRRLIFTLALLAAAPLAAQDPDPAAQGGTLPEGWSARLDRPNASLADVRFVSMGSGYHATTGPAAIFWNPASAATGEFRARASFTQTRAPKHPEAYGLFIAGQELEAGADYLYFLVRGDGKYLVKHRAPNGETHTLVEWTEHAAVKKQDEAGKATNALAVEGGEAGVRFRVNGTQVAEILKKDVPSLNTDGVVGLRVNHNLDVHVDGFAVEKR